jgi:dihydroneopterin aldolase
MTIASAFGALEDRRAGGEGKILPDRLILRDYVVEAEIGAFQLERGIRQRLRFSIVVELARPEEEAGDDVDRILSYDRLIEAVDDSLAGERLDLLETLADRIVSRVLAEPMAGRVFLRIEKLDRGPWVLGIEVVRERAAGDAISLPAAPRPIIAFFRGAVADLDRRMQKLTALDRPVIIVLGLPDLPRPKAGEAMAQFRIDLLLIEQAAWSLASRDKRLSVVSSRTEIDWAVRRKGIIVWAPTKLVTDTPGAPDSLQDDFALALWLAKELNAERIVTHGNVAAPAESRIPVGPL